MECERYYIIIVEKKKEESKKVCVVPTVFKGINTSNQTQISS